MRYRIIRVPLVLAALSAAVLDASAAPPAPDAPAQAATEAPVVIAGRVSTADGAAPGDLELRVRAGNFADVTPVDAAGEFVFELPAGVAADSLELVVDARDRAARRYHPALVRIPRDELHRAQHVVLVPRRWTIAAGRYAGTQLEISLELAYRPTCPGCDGFFRVGSRLDERTGAASVPAWPDEHFPLRVAFDRARSDAPITARDSAAFWKIAGDAQAVFGRALFVPVAYPQTLPVDDHGPNDVILVWIDRTLRNPGLSTLGFYRNDIMTAAVWLRRTTLITDPFGPTLVMHELLHALGFGHTCGWRSILADVTRCPSMRSPVPSPEDVAYVEVALAVNALTRGSTTRWGVEAAHAGERWSHRDLAADDSPR